MKNKYDFTQIFTSKFVHAFVCDVTNFARYIVFAYILYLSQPKWALILFFVCCAHYLSSYLFTKALKQEATKMFEELQKQMTEKK